MRLDWHVHGDYEEAGGVDILRDAVQEALNVVPPEHLRHLDALIVRDADPKGKSLGIWRQDHSGVAIELYLEPHVAPLLLLSPPARDFALRLHLAYTLFHEAGHHVTRFLNRRAPPSRKTAQVEQKIEKWADEYAEKRLAKLCERWVRPGGRAHPPEQCRAFQNALRLLRMDSVIRLPREAGTNAAEPSS